MKRTSLWETTDSMATMDRAVKERVRMMLDGRAARDEDREVDLYRPMSVKGRKVVVRRGMPWRR